MTRKAMVLHMPGSEAREARLDRLRQVRENRARVWAKNAKVRLPHMAEEPRYLVQHVAKLLRTSINNARDRGIAFSVTYDDVIDLGNRQQWKCAVSGIEMSLNRVPGCTRRPFAPRLDRINSAQGYALGNIRFVCAAVNLAMNEWGDSVFDVIATAYVANKKSAKL